MHGHEIEEFLYYSSLFIITFAQYFQVYENYQREVCEGYSYSYMTYNVLGWLLYVIYITVGYFNPAVVGDVEIYDIVFAWHTFLVAILLGVEVFYYDENEMYQEFKQTHVVFISIISLVLFTYSLFAEQIDMHGQGRWPSTLKVIAMLISAIWAIKYILYIQHNYERKNSIGMNPYSVIFESIGGVALSLYTLVCLYNNEPWTHVMTKKLTIGLSMFLYNIVLLFQYYVIYVKDRYEAEYKKYDEYMTENYGEEWTKMKKKNEQEEQQLKMSEEREMSGVSHRKREDISFENENEITYDKDTLRKISIDK